MKIGIFTPTHNTRWLAEAHASLKNQTLRQPLRWSVVLSGKAKREELPVEDGVVIDATRAPAGLDGSVGALKYLACSRLLAAGCDMLVELDHDDQLAPDCLAELAAAAEKTPGGFYYSDTVRLLENGKCQSFAANYGWEYYPTADNARFAVRAFPPTARSLAEIFYAPDHVRAWSRAAYEAAGGHAVGLPVTDDQELIQRTYLAGAPFVRIPKPLYIYRVHASTSATDRNAEIQQRQAQHRNRNLAALALEQCRRENLPAIDLGAAHGCPAGWTGLDARPGAAIQADALLWLQSRAPNSVGAIRAHDFLEHVHPSQTVALMNATWRALIPGGMFLTSTPSTDGRGAFQDPTHVSFWNANSFWYYTQSRLAKFVPEITAKFQAVRIETGFPSPWHQENNIPYVVADLCAWKSARQPGRAYQ